MAEQDFEIKIRINADTSQVETIRRSFQQLGAQVEVTNRQAAAAGQAARSASQLGTVIGAATGLGIGAGLNQFVANLQNASKEIIKISESLDKQGQQLLENSMLFGVQAKHAQDTGDVIKISENALKQIETTQKTLNELQQKELGMAEKFSDYMQVQLLARQKLAGIGDYEAARQENINTAAAQNAAARAAAIKEIDDAQKAQNRTNDEVISDLEKAVQLEKDRAATARSNNDPTELAKAVTALNQYNQELDKAIQKRERLNAIKEKATEKGIEDVTKDIGAASPQAQRILQNEAAMFRARAAGQGGDADMFEKSALLFRRGATPGQLQEVENVYKSPDVVAAIERLAALWR